MPEGKKRVSKKIKGTKDQLVIEKMILRNCKRKLTGLRMVCIYTTRRHMTWKIRHGI